MTQSKTTQTEAQGTANRWSLFAGFFLTFFPVILAAASFAATSIWSGGEDWLKSHGSAIWAAVLLVFLAEFWRSDQSRRRSHQLLSEMHSRVAPEITSHDFPGALTYAFSLRPSPNTVRVFALSSWRIQPLVEQLIDKSSLNSVQLLLANPDEYYVEPSEIFAQELSLAVEWKWLDMVRSQKITKLEVCQYDFFPTEWFILLDDDVVVFGDFEFDKNSVARARTSQCVFVAANSGAGAVILRNKCRKFQLLFDSCRDEFGVNQFPGSVMSNQNLETGKWPRISAECGPDNAE